MYYLYKICMSYINLRDMIYASKTLLYHCYITVYDSIRFGCCSCYYIFQHIVLAFRSESGSAAQNAMACHQPRVRCDCRHTYRLRAIQRLLLELFNMVPLLHSNCFPATCDQPSFHSWNNPQMDRLGNASQYSG